MKIDYDDTLPLPEEVAREFYGKAGSNETSFSDLDELPPGAAVIQYRTIWNPETGRCRFIIYAPDHIGPKHPPELAIPIIEGQEFLDLLCISEGMTFVRITGRAAWLGREHLALPVVRLHPHPMDWIEAGCTGVCHIEPVSRKALKDLTRAVTIECNCIYTALEAWDWGFGGVDEYLSRFSIDDSPYAIRMYFQDIARGFVRNDRFMGSFANEL